MKNLNGFTKAADLKAEYEKKCVPAAEAVKVVKSGDRVHIGQFGGVCRDLEAALAGRAGELEDVTLFSTNYSLPELYKTIEADPEGKAFKIVSTHMSHDDRIINKQGREWFMPILFHQGNKRWAELGEVNVAFVMTGPMDAHGNFNFGITNAEVNGVIQSADIVIVEANKTMPNCCGMENYVNLSEVDFVVEADYPLPELPVRDAGGADAIIADLIIPYIENGSCLQLGIGAMPNRVGQLIAESDLGDFSVHTEMLVDSFVDLYNAGKITGRKKTNPGKMIYTFAQGTKKLYDFLDNNPVCMNAPSDYVNNMSIIGSNDKMVSINSCLSMDIYGQVDSESVGHLHISGTGGQLDFVMGAYLSEGGKSFICTPSLKTKKDGTTESLIKPFLPEGSIVTCPRSAVDYVVTEYGVAHLRGMSTWERAEAIIGLAHPDYRDQLIKDAEKQGIWKTSSKLL